MKKLSVVIPVYNELATLGIILKRVVEVLPELEMELILVDDGSDDGTREWLLEHISSELDCVVPFPAPEGRAEVTARVVFHEVNGGKGAALRTAFARISGDVVVIQDADLEYDPRDLPGMFRLMVEGYADVVYGSRFYGKPHRVLYVHHLLGNKTITFLLNMLCNTTLSDIEVCYKMFRREVLDGLKLTAHDFGIEVELTTRIAISRRWRIYETGICYYGRTYEEGKKINWKDGVKALWYVFKYRFFAGSPYR